MRDVAVVDWQGPVGSAHGTYLVRVLGRSAPRIPALDGVREGSRRIWARCGVGSRTTAAIQALRERYEVRMPVAEPVGQERR